MDRHSFPVAPPIAERTIIRRGVSLSVLYGVLTAVGVTMLLPFFWMVSSSLKGPGEVFVFPPQWIPSPVKWSNYLEAWNAVPFGRSFLNSLFVTTATTVGQVFAASLAAFAFSRLRFRGRDALFFCYLATMMIPGVVMMIPVFVMLRLLDGLWDVQLFWGVQYLGRPFGLDSYFALIAPAIFTPFGTFLLRQSFMTIPRELEDAARIDGCGYLGIFSRIVIPLSRPALAALVIFAFMGAWRDFMWPLIVTNSMEMNTLPIILASFQGLYNTNWPLLMAGSVMVMAPLVVVFLLNQRHFVAGIQTTGLKG